MNKLARFTSAMVAKGARILAWLLLLLAVLIALPMGIGWGLRWLFTATATPTATAIVAGCFTIVASVIAAFYARHLEVRKQIELQQREKKIPVYEDLMGFFFKSMFGEKLGDVMSEQDMLRFMVQFTPRMVLWGSDDVLRAYILWRRQAVAAAEGRSASGLSSLLAFATMMAAIRRDVGYKNERIPDGDLMYAFVNDWHEHILRIATEELQAGTTGKNGVQA